MDSLDALELSLDNLEGVLLPLLDKSLSETLDDLELLQKAKLQVLLPYVVNDLVFIYLKTRGVNPKTHSVVGELDRIKQYFDKIKHAEDPEKRRFAVDQGAATRFIKHAIKESQAMQEVPHDLKQGTHTRFADRAVAGPSQGTAAAPKATGTALAKIQAREAALQQEGSSSEEYDLELIAETLRSNHMGDNTESKENKKKKVPETAPGAKRRRSMDPWAGYKEDTSGVPSPTDILSDKQRRKRGKKDKRPSATMDGGTPQSARTNVEIEMEYRPDGQNKIGQLATSSTFAAKKRKKMENEALEVIDVDALSLNPASSHESAKSRVIDVDAVESSRSDTPVQERKKRRKKKKTRPRSLTPMF